MSAGFVQAVWRYPVVGMAGELLRSSQIDARGVAGDRQHYARGPEGPLTLQDVPELGRWKASFPFNPDGAVHPGKPPPLPLLTAPDGAKSWRWARPRKRASACSSVTAVVVIATSRPRIVLTLS